MPPHTLLSAGSNAQGQLATGDTEDAYSFTPCSFLDCQPGALPPGTTRVLNIACGANHTLLCLERSDTQGSLSSSRIELWGSGDGSKGQLGPSITTSTQIFRALDFDLDGLGLGGYTVIQVAACWETSYVVLRCDGLSDVLLSMGADDYGDLGVGGVKTTSKKPRDGVYTVDLLENGLSTKYSGATINARSLVTGPHHVLVVLSLSTSDGQTFEHLVGWGSSRHGQLGDRKDPGKGKPIPFISSPHPIPLNWGQGHDTTILQVAAGTHHTVILHPPGRLSGLGSNRKGQLTAIDELRDVTRIGCTWNGTYAVIRQDDAWSIMSTGNHTKGQLGRQVHRDASHVHAMADVCFPFSHRTHELVKMACGSEHILTLVKDTTCQPPRTAVWGWGWNEHGNLGLAHTEYQDLPAQMWASHESQPSSQAVGIWAGCGTSWILLDS